MVVLNALRYLPGRVSQVLAVVSGTLTALSDGMQYGWTSPIPTILLSPDSPIPTTHTDIAIMEMIYMFGGVCSIPLTIYLLDKIGRKNTILIAAVGSLVAWIMIAFASSIPVLYVARGITGIAADINFVATPIYIAEISDKHIRGRLGSVVYIMMVIGIVLIYSIGTFVPIMVSSIVGASIVILQLLTFSFMPESPYYYLIKNRKEDARKSLQSFRSADQVDEELDEMEKMIKKENLERGNVLDLFKVKSNLKAVIIMTVLNFSQHFSGISVMFMNMHMILEDSESILSANSAAIAFSCAMLVACTVSGSLMDKLGRKVLLYTSSFLTAVSLLLLAAYFTVKLEGTDVSTFNWIPVFAVMLYAVTYKYGLGLVPIVLTAEIFPTNVKAFGVTYEDLVYSIASVLSIYTFYSLETTFGIDAPFYLFGGCCMLTCLFSIFFIPETKGKTLEEIQCILKGIPLTTTNCEPKQTDQSVILTSSIEKAISYGTN